MTQVVEASGSTPSRLVAREIRAELGRQQLSQRRLAMQMGLFIVALLAPFAVAQPAHASTTYEPWRFGTADICVETHGWKRWPAVEATQRWDVAADIHIYAWYDCSSRLRSQVVVLRVYDNPDEYACAKTGSEGGYDWVESGGQWTWIPRRMTIWLNMAAKWASRCRATPGQRAHIISHELGHAIGVGHRTDVVSVMNGWGQQWPTCWDLLAVETRYPW